MKELAAFIFICSGLASFYIVGYVSGQEQGAKKAIEEANKNERVIFFKVIEGEKVPDTLNF